MLNRGIRGPCAFGYRDYVYREFDHGAAEALGVGTVTLNDSDVTAEWTGTKLDFSEVLKRDSDVELTM